MHPSIKRAYDLLDQLDQQEAEHEVWRAEHREELAAAEVDALLAKSAATIKQRDFNGLIYKRHDDALQQPQATTMSPELQRQWNEWCDQRVRQYVELVVKIVAQESGTLVREEIETATAPLRAEIAALRTEVGVLRKKGKRA